MVGSLSLEQLATTSISNIEATKSAEGPSRRLNPFRSLSDEWERRDGETLDNGRRLGISGSLDGMIQRFKK